MRMPCTGVNHPRENCISFGLTMAASVTRDTLSVDRVSLKSPHLAYVGTQYELDRSTGVFLVHG